jgi:hypothetical protein
VDALVPQRQRRHRQFVSARHGLWCQLQSESLGLDGAHGFAFGGSDWLRGCMISQQVEAVDR